MKLDDPNVRELLPACTHTWVTAASHEQAESGGKGSGGSGRPKPANVSSADWECPDPRSAAVPALQSTYDDLTLL